ncbi:MAG: tyrosine-type recombinase/integrase [Deltaproteobacteria bacterium]|nr:tyrosine-type recombinase/integrase [Deltaproteobacteria bacterium]
MADDFLSAFVRHLAERRSPRTIATYLRVAEAFADFADVGDYSARIPVRSEVEAFLGRPRLDGGRRSPAGRNQELAALRVLSAFALAEQRWTTSPCDGLPFGREPPRDPPVLTAPEVRRLFEAAAAIGDPTRRALVLAVLAVATQAALRVHEIAALDVGQVDLGASTLLAVRGKGGTVHDLPLNAPSVAILRMWIARRASLLAETEPALFLSARKTRLSIRSIQHMVAVLARASGTAKRVSPHVLRHSTATLALTMGVDVATVGELLRHSDLNVTRRYLHLVDARRREAVRRLGSTIPGGILEMGGPNDGGPDARPGDGEEFSRKIDLDVQHGLDDAA